MYRNSSFLSTGQMSQKIEEDDVAPDHPNIVYLKTHGKVGGKSLSTENGGRLLTLWNFPLRNKLWRFSTACFHPRTGTFALADERGQVFRVSMHQHIYESLRLASNPVTALCFVVFEKTHLVIAYANSTVVVVDTHKRVIVYNIQLAPHVNNAVPVVTIIRSHPTKPQLLFGTVDGQLCLWDLSSNQCQQTMECGETIIEVKYELQGEVIAVCLERSGVFFYKAVGFHLLAHCGTKGVPLSAYCSVLYRVYWEETRRHSRHLNALLATSDGRLVTWFVGIEEGEGIQLSLKAHVFGAFTLPAHFGTAATMSFLGEVSQAPRISLLSQATGALMILESDGFQERSPGLLTCVADIPPEITQRTAEVHDTFEHVLPTAMTYPPGAVFALDASHEHLVVVCLDGAARLFVTRDMSGGSAAGKVFKARPLQVTETAQSQTLPRGASNQRQVLTRETTEQFGLYDFVLGEDKDDDDENNARSANHYQAKVAALKQANNSSSHTLTKKSSSASMTSGSGAAGTIKAGATQKSPAKGVTRRVKWQAHSFVTGNNGKHHSRDTNPAISSLPLFELAALTPREKQVNRLKLRAFLAKHGEYPARYRSLIWRFLLKLPENTSAFSDLVKQGEHPAMEDLREKYPIKSPKLFSRLHGVCSQLSHWASILGDASYLPSLSFPFTLIYGGDELASLETCITIFMWWGHSWHATHPNPPTHIVDGINNLLKLHDIKLYQHLLQRVQVSPGLLAWQMMSTLFSEILSRSSWLKLTDYLFTYFERITYFLLVPIAIFKDLKTVLLAADTSNKVLQLVRTQQNVRIEFLIKNLEELRAETPAKYFSGIATKVLDDQRFETGPQDVQEALRSSPEEAMYEEDEARLNLALSNGQPRFPLPVGTASYPAYDGYPQHIVDIQIRERNRVLALSKEVSRKEGVLKTLEEKINSLEADHVGWMTRHLNANESESRIRHEMMEKETQHLRELQRVEEEISSQRIRHLDTLEMASKEEMKALDQAVEAAQHLLAENEQHLKEKLDIGLTLHKHRELAEAAEQASMEKMRQLRLRRTREDWLKSVSGLMQAKEQELAAHDLNLQEKWRRQDDERRMLREHRQRELQEREEVDRMGLLQEEIAQRMHRLQLERESKLLEIERVRAVRLAKEQSDEALEAAERAAMFAKKQELLDIATAEANNQPSSSRPTDMQQQVETEMNRLIDAEKASALREMKARQQTRHAQIQREAADQMAVNLTQEKLLDQNVFRPQAAMLQSMGMSSSQQYYQQQQQQPTQFPPQPTPMTGGSAPKWRAAGGIPPSASTTASATANAPASGNSSKGRKTTVSGPTRGISSFSVSDAGNEEYDSLYEQDDVHLFSPSADLLSMVPEGLEGEEDDYPRLPIEEAIARGTRVLLGGRQASAGEAALGLDQLDSNNAGTLQRRSSAQKMGSFRRTMSASRKDSTASKQQQGSPMKLLTKHKSSSYADIKAALAAEGVVMRQTAYAEMTSPSEPVVRGLAGRTASMRSTQSALAGSRDIQQSLRTIKSTVSVKQQMDDALQSARQKRGGYVDEDLEDAAPWAYTS